MLFERNSTMVYNKMTSLKNTYLQMILLSFVIVFTLQSRAEILFEGYSKVLSGGVPIGYYISRYEFDTKKKQFVSTSFLKTNDAGGGITESLQAYASDDFKPISYSYTTIVGKTPKTIDAKFEKNKIIATVRNNGKEEKIIHDLPKGTFLSTFLAYVILKSPQGMKADTKYDYQAIAEEEASIVKGLALVKKQEEIKGLKAFHVANEFKGVQFISNVTDKGEVIATRSPAQGISTELVGKPSEATLDFQVPAPLIKKLFGEVPTGQKNAVSQQNHKPDFAPIQNLPNAGKQQGVAPGQGIQLKSGTQESKDMQQTSPSKTGN